MLDNAHHDELSFAGGLSPENRDRVTQLLDDYLVGLERGEPVSADRLIEQNPDLSSVLRMYLANLHDLYGLAGRHASVAPAHDDSSLASAMHSPHRGMQLDDYELLQELGRGGMGIVYEAKQISLNRRVAIKLLPMAGLLDPKRIARFQNESQTAAQLSHPHIVPVYSVGSDRGVYYYVMPLIDGLALDQWISIQHASTAKTAWKTILRWIIDVADALHETHQCGIVHRDIKPSNLMVDREGKSWVTDFGLARCQNELSLTASGDLVGTMRYMSPEQSLGRAELVDHRTDIYSLAATLYELLTLQPAVRGDDGPSLLRFIEREQPFPLQKLNGELPHDLAIVVHKALSKIRSDRYATMREFADDLNQVLLGGTIAARPLPWTSRLGRWVVRNQVTIGISFIGLALATAGFAISNLLIAAENRIATKNADKANFFVQQAHTAVDQFGAQVAEELAGIPGAEAARLSVLKETLRYYENFITQAANNTLLQSDLAKTHSRIASLHRELYGSSQAIAHYEQADALYQQINSESPQSVSTVLAQAENLNHLGLARTEQGDFSEAEASFIKAIHLQQQLLLSVTEDRGVLVELALSESNLGLMYRQAGNPQQASQLLQSAVDRLQPMSLATRENDPLVRRGLAAALVNLSSLNLDSAPQQSIQYLQQAIDLQLLSGVSPREKMRSGYELANSYNNLGVAYRNLEQYPQAIDSFLQAIELQRQLISIAPEVLTYRSDLAASMNNLAASYQAANDDAAAERTAREGVVHQQFVVEKDTNSVEALSRLGTMESNWALALESLSQSDEADQAFQSSLSHQRQALQDAPHDELIIESLASVYGSVIQTALQRQDWPAIANTCDQMVTDLKSSPFGLRRSLELLDHLVKLVPDSATILRLETLRAELQRLNSPEVQSQQTATKPLSNVSIRPQHRFLRGEIEC